MNRWNTVRASLSLLILTVSLDMASARSVKPSNCTIEVLNQMRNGEKYKLTFKTRLKNPGQCKRLADYHRPIFNVEVAKKEVSYHWLGPKNLR